MPFLLRSMIEEVIVARDPVRNFELFSLLLSGQSDLLNQLGTLLH